MDLISKLTISHHDLVWSCEGHAATEILLVSSVMHLNLDSKLDDSGFLELKTHDYE